LPKLHSEYDGSGKLRAKNAEQIKKHVPALLDQYPPKQYNIVISSGGAGSGAFLLFYRKLLCVFIFFACTNHKYLLETLDICIICIIIINTNDTYFYAIGNFIPII
jgi:hypothetical protein